MAAVGRLRYVGADLAKLVVVNSKHDKLLKKIWLLEEEHRMFDEHLLLFSMEKFAAED